MEFIRKRDFLEAMEEKYEDLTDESGCSVRTENGYEWLSISNIVELVHCCETYDGGEEEIEEMERRVEHLEKKVTEIKAEYEKRLELMRKALIELSRKTATVPTDVRVSKLDFIAMHTQAVCDMDGCEDNDIYGHDITVHWHGFYCNCGDGATPANYIIPAIEDCWDEDPIEY